MLFLWKSSNMVIFTKKLGQLKQVNISAYMWLFINFQSIVDRWKIGQHQENRKTDWNKNTSKWNKVSIWWNKKHSRFSQFIYEITRWVSQFIFRWIVSINFGTVQFSRWKRVRNPSYNLRRWGFKIIRSPKQICNYSCKIIFFKVLGRRNSNWSSYEFRCDTKRNKRIRKTSKEA